MHQRSNRRRPHGFTIVELLVAMALIVFIMYVLAEAFSAGAGAFRTLKAVGDMNERLRVAGNLLRKYLAADHFEGKKRLSDPDFWKDGPPREGFFRLVQYSAPAKAYNAAHVNEGSDLDGNGSNRATNHVLHWTVKLRGNNRQEMFRASVPGGSPLLKLPFPDSRFEDGANTADGRGVITSPWAEMCLFMNDTGETTKDLTNASGIVKGVDAEQKLYTLCLRQRLVLPSNDAIRALSANANVDLSALNWMDYREVSCLPNPLERHMLNLNPGPNPNSQQTLYFNTPADLTMPSRRWSGYFNPLKWPSPQKDSINQIPDELNLLWPTGTSQNQKAEYPYPTYAMEEAANPNSPPSGYAVLAGSDVLLTDVLSCDIKLLFAGNKNENLDFVNLFDVKPKDYWTGKNKILTDPAPGGFNNAVSIFDTWSQAGDEWCSLPTPVLPLPNPPELAERQSYRSWWNPADTAPVEPNKIPMYVNASGQKIRVLAIQITLRIWDSRTQQTRQTSVVVDL